MGATRPNKGNTLCSRTCLFSYPVATAFPGHWLWFTVYKQVVGIGHGIAPAGWRGPHVIVPYLSNSHHLLHSWVEVCGFLRAANCRGQEGGGVRGLPVGARCIREAKPKNEHPRTSDMADRIHPKSTSSTSLKKQTFSLQQNIV
jgi:hypothetical protein